MANYSHDGPQRLAEAGRRSYGALKSSLQRLGTPTSQHNVEVTKSAKKSAKKTAKKTHKAQKPTAKKAVAAKSTAKSTTKKAVKKTAAKKS